MTARMNISLPDQLKARMDAVTVPVNWSALAATAYERQLELLTETRRSGDLAAVVERLRASRAVHTGSLADEPCADAYGAGLGAGMTWAREHAEWPELVRLEQACGAAEELDWQQQTALVGACEAALAGGSASEFWAAHGGPECDPAGRPTTRFVQGFCDGALTVFEQVKLQLAADPR